ncbi:MAG: laminin B domain-containing protein, partial [Anaerolineales bacterium]
MKASELGGKMYTSRSALTVVRRHFPRVRIHRLRPAIFKFLNAVVISSMLSSMSGVAMAIAASDVDMSVENPLPSPHKNIEALVEPNIVQSTFDSDDEGWTIVGDGDGPTYNANGGNPGGYITATDLALEEYWYWQAPAKFLGDQSAAYGRTLSFDLVQSATDSQEDQDDVILIGDGVTLVFDTPYNPGDTWTNYVISLHESAGWLNSSTGLAPSSAEFIQVLTN